IDITQAQLDLVKRPEFRRVPLLGPQVVYLEATAEEQAKAVTALLSGEALDLQHRPRFYVPWEERRREALAQAKTLAARRRHHELSAPVEQWLAREGRTAEDFRYIPGRAPFRWFVVVLDAASGDVVKLLPADFFQPG